MALAGCGDALSVYRESVGRVVDARTKHLLAELQKYPGVSPEWRSAADPETEVLHGEVMSVTA